MVLNDYADKIEFSSSQNHDTSAVYFYLAAKLCQHDIIPIQALLSDRNIAMLSGALSSKEECKSIVNSLQYPIPVSLSQVGKSSMIILSNSDIDSAVDCLADKAFYASGMKLSFLLRDLRMCVLSFVVLKQSLSY